MGVPRHVYVDKDNPSMNGESGDDLASTRPASSGGEDSCSENDFAAVYSEVDCMGDYKEVPHNMGRSQHRYSREGLQRESLNFPAQSSST